MNFFTTTSYTYYTKYKAYRSTYAEVYKNFIMVKLDLQLNLKIIMSTSNNIVIIATAHICDCITHSFSVTSANIAMKIYRWKLDSLGYISAAESVSVSSTTFTLCATKATEFGEITHGNGLYAVIKPFKVIQGHRVWYQSTVHMRLPISDYTNLPPILHRFRDIAFDRSKPAIFGYPSCV